MPVIFRCLKSIGLVLILLLPGGGRAQMSGQDPEHGSLPGVGIEGSTWKTNDTLSREMTNPLAAFYRLAYQVEYKTYQGSLQGASDQAYWINTLQPVIPFAQKNGKGFVLSFAIPISIDQPIYKAEREYPEWLMRRAAPVLIDQDYWATAHGHSDDVNFDLVYGGVRDGGLILMYGLAGILPTASDTTNARQQLILGPELNIGKMHHWGEYGAVISHVFDVAEKKNKGTPDTNITSIQVYFGFALGGGWQLISNPRIEYDWEADRGNKLTLPLGGGVAKTTRIGHTPLRMSAQVEKYVASADRFGPDWLIKLSITPVLPNKYTRTH